MPLYFVKSDFIRMTKPEETPPILDMARGKIPESRVQATARRIKAVRLALGVSKTEMAKATGIGIQTISNWENEVSEPMLDNAFRLLDVYGITLEYIYRGDLRHLPHNIVSELGTDNTPKGKRLRAPNSK